MPSKSNASWEWWIYFLHVNWPVVFSKADKINVCLVLTRRDWLIRPVSVRKQLLLSGLHGQFVRLPQCVQRRKGTKYGHTMAMLNVLSSWSASWYYFCYFFKQPRVQLKISCNYLFIQLTLFILISAHRKVLCVNSEPKVMHKLLVEIWLWA